jgi:glycine cleavage system transcriptional repressor
MKKFMLLFCVGKDRPGIVDAISTVLFEQGANIEDSRMATLGGRFSSMTLFSCTATQLEAIRADLDALAADGLESSLHEAQDPAACPVPAALPLKCQVTAMDHPGIVKQVVHLLHRHQINITSLSTQVIRAPLSGAPLFDLKIEAWIPAAIPVAEVKNQLRALAQEMNLDLTFQKQ